MTPKARKKATTTNSDSLAPVYAWLVAIMKGDLQKPVCVDDITKAQMDTDPRLCKALGIINDIYAAIVRARSQAERDYESELPRNSRKRGPSMRDAAKGVDRAATYVCTALIESYERHPAAFRDVLIASRQALYLGRAEHGHSLAVGSVAHDVGIDYLDAWASGTDKTRKLPRRDKQILDDFAALRTERPGLREKEYHEILEDRYEAQPGTLKKRLTAIRKSTM